MRELIKRILPAPAPHTLASLGAEPGGMSVAEFGAYFNAETAKWGKVVREAGIVPD